VVVGGCWFFDANLVFVFWSKLFSLKLKFWNWNKPNKNHSYKSKGYLLHSDLTMVGRAVVIMYDLTYNLRKDVLKMEIPEIRVELCEKNSEKSLLGEVWRKDRKKVM
jgi:hypothetical protein